MECPAPIEGLLRIKKNSGMAATYKRRHVKSVRGALEMRKDKKDGIPLSHIYFAAITDIVVWCENSVNGITITSSVQYNTTESKTIIYRIQCGTRDYRNYWYSSLRQLWTYYNMKNTSTKKRKIERLNSRLDKTVVAQIKREQKTLPKDKILKKIDEEGQDGKVFVKGLSRLGSNKVLDLSAVKGLDRPVSELNYLELIDRLRVLNQTQALFELEVVKAFERQHKLLESYLREAEEREARQAQAAKRISKPPEDITV